LEAVVREAIEPFGTIVLGYDGTLSAERALTRAVQLASAFDAKVIVTDVVPVEHPASVPPGAFGLAPYHAVTPVERGVRLEEALWQQHRAQVEAFLAQSGVAHEFAGAIGEPVREIIDTAEQRAADLIVVGTREPGFLERILGGSVSQGVARRAHCDVLVVHPSSDGE
jgi:nucleotide-binding universal stress UspA family protein